VIRDIGPWLIEHGFPPDGHEALIANLTTPLMLASRLGATATVRALVGRGVSVNTRNADGNNALWFACVSEDLGSIDALLAAGIDIDNLNDNGATCLMYAASSGKAAVVARLLAAGARLHHQTLDGFTALDMAATLDCLRLLLQAQKREGRRLAGAA
jgi:thiosulfate/3-mercaptopyruvate sulfurtransferase